MSLPFEHNSPSFVDKYRFWLIIFSAALLMQVPVVSVPLKWFESFFHEISHGIAALVTGGTIVRIELFPNGAGLCTTRGGLPLFISFFGYAGAVCWGALIYWISQLHQRIAQFFSGFIAFILIVTMLLWVRDFLTFAIVSVLLVIILLKFKLSNLKYFQLLLQLIAAVVLLNSVKSPLYLIDGRELGDGAALASITMIPEFIWIALWCALGLLAIIMLAKSKVKINR